MQKNKKQIALITTNQMDIGIRTLSGVLKNAGYETKLINLSSRESYHPLFYPDKVKNNLIDILGDCEVIGISIADLFLKRAQDLATWIKSRTGKKIILGGIHAQLYPEECIDINGVDAVCIGEGIKTVCALLDNDKWYDISVDDFWIKRRDGGVNKGKLLPMLTVEEILNIPLPDYSYDKYWLLNQAEFTIESMNTSGGCFKIEQHQVGHQNSFVASFMMGCVNNCSFCNITALSSKWRKDCPQNKWFRIKSNHTVFKELELIKENNPNIKFMCIMDNDFTARGEKDVKQFFDYFKKNIDVPIYLMVSPNTLTEAKLKSMIDGGVKEINLGIQTNEMTNYSLYGRPITDAMILEKASLINKYKEKIYPFYDLIIFNPEESESSILTTIAFIKKLPIPFDLVPHILTLGPEVPLYKTLQENGKMHIDRKEAISTSDYHIFNIDDYSDWKTFYLNLIIYWMGGGHSNLYYGRLPRTICNMLNIKDFSRVLTQNKIILKGDEDTLDVLLSSQIYDLMVNQHDTLKAINAFLGELRFSNQEAYNA